MKLSVDKEADALHLRLDDSTIVESEEVSPGVVLDYNESNEVVGVEMQHNEMSMSSCSACGSAERRDEAVDEVFNVDGDYVLVARSVPSTVCLRCGERSFSRADHGKGAIVGHEKPAGWSVNRRSRRDPCLCVCTNTRERAIAWS